MGDAAGRFGDAADWGVTREAGPWHAGLGRGAGRGGQGRDDGLELVWRWFGGIAETVIS